MANPTDHFEFSNNGKDDISWGDLTSMFAGRDLGMVVVDPFAEVVAALEHAQQLADDVLAQHAVLLAVDEHLAALPVDAEVVDDAAVVAQLQAGVERIAPQVVTVANRLLDSKHDARERWVERLEIVAELRQDRRDTLLEISGVQCQQGT